MSMAAEESQEHYQLYKLLAFAVQELSFFASSERMQETLELPQSINVITNRAQMAIDRINDQNPHFYSGYIKYNSNKPHPPMEGR